MALSTLLKVLAFLAALWGGAQLLRRRSEGQWPGATPRHLRLIESLQLGQERSVHVIEADGRRLLLGASRGGVSVLAELSTDGSRGVQRGFPVGEGEQSANCFHNGV